MDYTRKINRGYQFTLPQAFRDAYHLQVGDYLKVHEANGKLVIEPVTLVPKNPEQALRSLFDSSTNHFDDLSEDDILKMVHKEIKKHRQASKSNLKGKADENRY